MGVSQNDTVWVWLTKYFLSGSNDPNRRDIINPDTRTYFSTMNSNIKDKDI